MPLTGELFTAVATFGPSGLTLEYAANLYDENGEFVGGRTRRIHDPEMIALFTAFVTSRLPQAEQQMGVPLRLPVTIAQATTTTPEDTK
jgi:hypothetical protein